MTVTCAELEEPSHPPLEAAPREPRTGPPSAGCARRSG
jgi:hypothetical protein